jgi:transposase
METGTHSPWVSRLLTELGHEVIVAHAQKVQLITKSNRKRMTNYTELLKQVKGVGTQIALTVGKTDAIRLRRWD